MEQTRDTSETSDLFDVSFVRRLTGERSRAPVRSARSGNAPEEFRGAVKKSRFAFFASRPHTGRVSILSFLMNPIFPVCAFRRVFLVFGNAAVPTRPRGFFLPSGTPRGNATHEAARDRPEEGFVFGKSPARDSVGGVKARRRDVSPVVRVGDRPFVRHPDPRRARWRGDARSGGAGGSAARFRARLAGWLHVADASSPPRGGAALGRRACLAGRQRRGRRLELRRRPVDGFVPRRFRRA